MTDRVPARLRNFTPVKDEFARERGLIQAAVYGRIWRFAQGQRHVCDASMDTIADCLGIDRSTAYRAAVALVADGYLEDLTPERVRAAHAYAITGKLNMELELSVADSINDTNETVAQNNSLLHTATEKGESVAHCTQRKSERKKVSIALPEPDTSAPQQSQPIASNGIIPFAGNGTTVRAAAKRAGRVQKAVKAAGAAAIVAALPAEQADKARKMLRGYLAGKAIAQDKTPSKEIPDDEFVAAHAVHVVGINGGYKPSDVLNCVVWLVRVQQRGLMYITPKSTVANLAEWRAAGSPKYSGGVEV